jgi:hypothetical protein
MNTRWNANADFQRERAEHYEARVGADESGTRTVLGIELRLVDDDDGRLQAAAPSILEGFRLANLIPCFEAFAVASAVRGHAEWGGLKWLCYLNEADPGPTAEALRRLSADIRMRVPEAGVHPGLPARAAALLLWLSGLPTDEETAASIDSDSLAHPSRSWFPLERRHVELALADRTLNLHARIQQLEPGRLLV